MAGQCKGGYKAPMTTLPPKKTQQQPKTHTQKKNPPKNNKKPKQKQTKTKQIDKKQTDKLFETLDWRDNTKVAISDTDNRDTRTNNQRHTTRHTIQR